MNKEEIIKRYGIEAYEKMQQQAREWKEVNPEKRRECSRLWYLNNPQRIRAISQNQCRKGGKYYEQRRQHQMTGIPHERELVRKRHGDRYRPYKKIIAPDSQIHHEWIPNTPEYRGIALVEKDQHMHGFIDVIQILEGEITLLTEEEIRMSGK